MEENINVISPEIERNAEIDEIKEKRAITTEDIEALSVEPEKKKEKTKNGSKVSHVFWILFQVFSVLAFFSAVICLLISPAFPPLFSLIPKKPGPDAGWEGLGYAIEVVLYVIFGIIVGFLMIVRSFFKSIKSIIAGFIGFLISVIKRPKGKKWKAVVSFGLTTTPPVLLAILDAILIIIGVIIAIISAVSSI